MPDISIPKNRLLTALPKKEYKTLLPKLEGVPLVFKKIIYEAGDVIQHVYFPESGIISLLSRVDDHSSIEVGLVGDEGLAGLPVFLGTKTSGNAAVVQGEGAAVRISVPDFHEACENGNKLPQLILRYINSLLMQISQASACNRFHQIEARLARWLLMTQDRMHADEFQITQEFMSNMLGVRREAVNLAAGGLQRRGLIKYTRGNLAVLNCGGLEKAACPCYATIKKEYDELSASGT